MKIPEEISQDHVIAAISDFDTGVAHSFGESRKYDLIWKGQAYPPKAILGLAAAYIHGKPLNPKDFSGGIESKSTKILKSLGFEVVEKEQTWKAATLRALQDLSELQGRRFFEREVIINEKLDWIIEQVSAVGKTNAQTLSRVLQELRDEGHLEFDGKGRYRLLQGLGEPRPEDFPEGYEVPERASTTVHRILRDAKIVKELKTLYGYRCSLCECRIELPTRAYCEAHHVKPLGGVHEGPDSKRNLIIVCPNHHVMLDYGAIELHEESFALRRHSISPEFIEYHNKEIFGKANPAPGLEDS